LEEAFPYARYEGDHYSVILWQQWKLSCAFSKFFLSLLDPGVSLPALAKSENLKIFVLKY
jgi:hypothetical protein